MKKGSLNILYVSIFCGFIIGVFFSCSSLIFLINGNGKIRAQEIAIGDYDKISISNAFEYEYVHGVDSSFLIIETDENLIPYFHCYVKNRTLYIEIKNPETGESISNYRINSSKCLIRTGSPQLLQVVQTGTSEFTIVNSFTANSFELYKNGSGLFCFRKEIQLGTLKMVQNGSGSIIVRDVCRMKNMTVLSTGSGNVEFYNLIQGQKMDITSTGSGLFLSDWDINVDILNFDHKGSGNSTFNGIISAEQFAVQQSGSSSIACNGFLDIGVFNLNKTGSNSLSLKQGVIKKSLIYNSGSGGVTGLGCTFLELGCNIVGSAYVTATVTESLSYSIAGSGRLTVHGNPQVKHSAVRGSGSFILMKN